MQEKEEREAPPFVHLAFISLEPPLPPSSASGRSANCISHPWVPCPAVPSPSPCPDRPPPASLARPRTLPLEPSHPFRPAIGDPPYSAAPRAAQSAPPEAGRLQQAMPVGMEGRLRHGRMARRVAAAAAPDREREAVGRAEAVGGAAICVGGAGAGGGVGGTGAGGARACSRGGRHSARVERSMPGVDPNKHQ